MASTATRAQRRGGRPSKGDRHLFQSRVPRPLAEIVKQSADERGLNYSDYIAAVLAEKHDFTLPQSLTTQSGDNTVQEELPMQTAS